MSNQPQPEGECDPRPPTEAEMNAMAAEGCHWKHQQDTPSPLDVPLYVSFIRDQRAREIEGEILTMRQLANRIRAAHAPTKESLPWLKLAKFGLTKTEKGSLRHDGNMLAITGIELDYDAEQIPLTTAVRLLAQADIAALVYDSPRGTHDRHRWRILAPTSEDLSPNLRDHLLARINGLFGGCFSRESWAASQSYYYGAFGTNPPPRMLLVDGTYIDLATHLDSIAIGKPKPPKVEVPCDPVTGEILDAAPLATSGEWDEDRAGIEKAVNHCVDIAIAKVRYAADGTKHRTLRDQARLIGGLLHYHTMTKAGALRALLDALPDTVEDQGQAAKTAIWALERGEALPIKVEPLIELDARHKEAARQAMRLLRAGIPTDELIERMNRHNEVRDQPLTSHEIYRAVVWAARAFRKAA